MAQSAEPAVRTETLNLDLGPRTVSELYSWSELSWFETRPAPLAFGFNEAIDLIRDRLNQVQAQARHEHLPPVFFGTAHAALNTVTSVLAGTPLPFFLWPPRVQDADSETLKGAEEAGHQLLTLFNEWSTRYGETLTGTGDDMWFDVCTGLSAIGEDLSLVIWTRRDQRPKPFYKWEVVYNPNVVGSPVAEPASEIAAWFTRFSVHQVLHKLAILVEVLHSDPLRGASFKDMQNHLWGWLIEIDRTARLAEYWFDKAWSTAEAHGEYEKVLRHISRDFKWDEPNPPPDVAYKQIGIFQLMDWFSNSCDIQMSEVQLWRATWATLKDQAPPTDNEVIKSFYLQRHALAEKEMKANGETEYLPVLCRQIKNPKKKAVHTVVMRLISKDPGSAFNTLKRAKPEADTYKVERKDFSSRAMQRAQQKKEIVQDKADRI